MRSTVRLPRAIVALAIVGWLLAVAGGLSGLALRILWPAPVAPNTFGMTDPGMLAFVILGITWASVGVLLVLRRPENHIGRYMVVIGGGNASSILAAAITCSAVAADEVVVARIAGWSTVFLSSIGGLILYLPFIFPTGRGHTARWDAVGRGLLAATVGGFALLLLRPGGLHLFPTIANPFPFGPDLGTPQSGAFSTILLVCALTLVPLVAAAVITRYRMADAVERLQIKWAVTALSATMLALAATTASPVLASRTPELPLAAYAVAGTLVPIAIGVAILRHRLYDIDRLISRGLAYGAVSLILGAVFALAAVVLGGLLASVGQGQSIAVAISTLLVLGLFQPLRRRIQRLVDRRFDRERYDAERTVAALVGRLRADVDLESVRDDVVGVLGATFRPTQAGVWLRPNVQDRAQHGVS